MVARVTGKMFAATVCAALAMGCPGPEAMNTTGDPSSSSSSSSGGEASSSDDTPTTGGTEPVACDGPHPPYAGPLCGTANRPCVLALHEEFPPEFAVDPNIRVASALGWDCQPRIIFAGKPEDPRTSFAQRHDDGTWHVSTIGADLALATDLLVDRTDDAVTALIVGGAFTTDEYRRVDGQWTLVGKLPGNPVPGLGALVQDSATRLHFATGDLLDRLYYARKDGDVWTARAPIAEPVSGLALAVPPGADEPHLAFAAIRDGVPAIYWQRGDTEELVAVVSETLQVIEPHQPVLAIATIDGVERPRLLVPRRQAERRWLIFAERSAPGEWQLDEVAASNGSTCPPDAQEGDLCEDEIWDWTAAGGVTSGSGEAVLLALASHYQSKRVYECPNGLESCQWINTEVIRDITIRIVRRDGGELVTQDLTVPLPPHDDIEIRKPTAHLDARGEIHVVHAGGYFRLGS